MPFRKLDISFWSDVDMEAYPPKKKLLYLYLLTSPQCNQIGIYEWSPRQAAFHTGLSMEDIAAFIDEFQEEGKIILSKKSKELLIVKFYHHNKSNSPKVMKHCEDLWDQVKDKSLLNKTFGLQTEQDDDHELVYPWDTDEFMEMWGNWVAYKKKEFNFKYKSLQSQQAALNSLAKLAKDESEAIEIIVGSMANKWKGLWKSKKDDKVSKAQSTAASLLEQRGIFPQSA